MRLKGADTTCEAFTLIIPTTKEALVTAQRVKQSTLAERAPPLHHDDDDNDEDEEKDSDTQLRNSSRAC